VYEDGSDKFHPFVVVTEFDEQTGDAIVVSFSSTDRKPRYDTTLVIPAGSHKFITQESYAAYYLTARISQAQLAQKIKDREAFQGDNISEKILEELRAGIMNSKDTPRHLKDFYQDCLYRRMKKRTPIITTQS
jgi:hypothetical protein